MDGGGITSGLVPRRNIDPVTPTAAERRKPGLERSMSHQRSGLAMASAIQTWRVEVQVSLR